MTPEEQVRRAQRADLLLNDDLFKEAIAKIKQGAFDQFKEANAADIRTMQVAHMLFTVAQLFEGYFDKTIRDGEFAVRKIEDAKRKRPQVKAADKFVPRHAKF